ncbi:PorP/SprF family type IX secretion system membrane protein [Patiriisocius hiemis]|uniref:Type IX secretion system membrane protein PorP/SprF n=1 Tax=Patiriisocius hiemis TaxID=3075604 RepID=A0ABU2YCK3_9FLAO|nr:type IX secretion system membrane protein PorP/SprF [Constantimarinum sp. W242]MDT0555903.1 type IX secretion system membrane protein PorP/SprF [Constantimarinum sp. W242]
MKNFNIAILVLFALGLFTTNSYAQQDAQYTQYMYNPMSINPAYAGSRDVLSLVGIYRSQWVGLDGAPRTLNFSGHTPVGEKVGLGLNITRDEIFIANETYINAAFSYTVDVSSGGKLAFGIQGGAHLLDVDSRRANTGAFQNENQDPFANIFIDNKFSPQIGVGTYYYTDKFYMGLSVPNFIETEHFDDSENSNSSATAKEKINIYGLIGYVFDLNEDVKFKPAGLVKVVEGAPLQLDLSANFLIKEKVTLGAAYRWSAALSGMVGFQLSDQLMIGFAYDRETTELQQYNDGSYEILLRYELFNNKKRLLSPRFF